MAFSFGGGGGNNNTPAPGPPPAGGGFSLGAPAPVAPTPGGAAPAAPSFSFGGAAAPSAAAPVAGGGLSFGGTPAAPAGGNPSTPAPAAPVFGAAPPTAAAPATPAAPSTPGFSFGGTSTAPAPTPGVPAPASGFSLGGATPAPATPAAAPTPGAPTPAASGFSFGNNTPAPGAPAAAPTPGAPAPAASGFSFGGTPAPSATGAPAPPGGAPAPSTPGFGAAAPPTSLSSGSSTFGGALSAPAPGAVAAPVAPPAEKSTLEAPEFDSVFRNLELWSKIQKLCNQDTLMAGQELMHFVRTHKNDLKPSMPDWKPPNQALRQQLMQKPTLSIQNGATTKLTKRMYDRIMEISNDLLISEAEAATLYAQVSTDLAAIQSLPIPNLVDQGMGSTKKYGVSIKLARDFYFYERHLRLQTLLYMMQARLNVSEKRNGPMILEVTDLLLEEGLVPDLIKLIKDYTQRIQQLQAEIAASKPQIPVYGNQAMPPPPQQPARPNFRKVHLLFANQERQVACECLFFIAYQIQLTSSEMAGLLDLIRDLSTLAPLCNPFNNVPTPYEPASAPTIPTTPAWPPTAPPAAPFTYALKEKDPLVWQRELVSLTFESGVPQVLQCISMLVVSATAAMETRQVLFDRKLHGPNAFGTGNAFLPPNDMSLDGIREIHSRLNPDSSSQWARQDIWGVLAASYALLLRSAPALLSSPRAGGGGTHLASDIRHAASLCLELPTDKKAFTFSRLTLIPVLQRVQAATMFYCDPSEFALAVYADFFAHYLNVLAEGRMPISRLRWKNEQDEELTLRRAQQVQERELRAYTRTSFQEQAIPASVDLMERPDCLDDLIALATKIGSLGRDFSWKFWSVSADGEVLPSRILLALERATKDDSLLSSYLSLLAALANDEASAHAVHLLLSRMPDAVGVSVPITWTVLISKLRWYAQELSPYDNDVVSKPASTSTTTTSTKNTDYYYNLDGQDVPTSFTTSTKTTVTPGETSSTSSSSKAKELSTLASFEVASYLSVMANVALHCPVAQHAILSTSIPIGEEAASGSDEALLVLFKLAISPLSPQLRGTALSTIANLLRPPSMQDKEKDNFVREQAKHAWEYLESCPLLPIALLDQYGVMNVNVADIRNNAGLAFPPSSISLANNTTLTSVLPKNQTYGLIYAAEHVEARMGWYPSTEGFLQMLQSLVCTAGCPSKLGQNWRVRSGCAPYLEYVVDFILPRALGLRGCPQLPFRVNGDRSRLVSHAMTVVEAVVVRYTVPCKALKVKSGANPFSLLGIQSVVDTVVVADGSGSNDEAVEQDFKNVSISSYIPPEALDGTSSTAAPRSSGADVKIPSTKSPGFMILADILSSVGGIIFQAIGTILTEHGGADGIEARYGLQAGRMEVAYSLFGDTPPDISSAKEGAKEGNPSTQLQSLLKPLVPCVQGALVDPQKLDDATYWRENSIAIALRVLCAAATREEAFVASVLASKVPLKIVPVLRFQDAQFGSSSLRSTDVLLSRMSRLLFSIENSEIIRKSLVQYIGYSASGETQRSSLSSTAMSLFYFLHQSMPPQYSLQELCGNESPDSLAKAVAQRLVSSSKNSYTDFDAQTTTFILNWILSDLRAGTVGIDGLTQVLMGLPTTTFAGNWQPGTRKYAGSIIDCFDAILEILKDTDDAADVAASCFEIIFRLYDLLKNESPLSLRLAVYTAERLRSEKFWHSNTLLWLSHRGRQPLVKSSSASLAEANPDVLHCISWLLKGLACELQLLVGFTNCRNAETGSVLSSLLAPRPYKCDELLSLLFGQEEGIVQLLLENVPLERVSMDGHLMHPPVEALRSAVLALPGPEDVVTGYEQLDSKKVLKNISGKHSPEELDSMRAWSDQFGTMSSWNCAVAHLCQAAYNILDVSVGCSESLKLSGESHLGLQSRDLAIVLMLILHRLEATDGSHHGMDSRLLPAATCNLGNAVLVLADSITRFDGKEALTTSDLLDIASSLSRVLAFSASGEDSAVEAPTRYERTTVLGSSLSLLLRATHAADPGLIGQYRDEFIMAIKGLEKLACFKVDTNSSESHSIVAVLARSSIGEIVNTSSDESDSFEHSFVSQAISKSFVQSLLRLETDLDDHVCSLLQTIALQPYGTTILVDAGICRSLQAAAKAYLSEEERVERRLRNGGAAYNKTTIRTPSFLLGHLKLMSALMASSSLPDKRATEVALSLLETFALYKRIVQRLCSNFPTEADVLRWFLRCLVQAASLAQPANTHERHELLSNGVSKVKNIFLNARFLENGIAMLCQHLWENPFPKDMLPDTPALLQDTDKDPHSGVVSVEKNRGQTWWNVLDNVLLPSTAESLYEFNAPTGRNDFGYWSGRKQKVWADTKFEYSIAAMDVLSLGLSLMKRMDRFDMIDGRSLARGLFKCACAAESVGNRLDEIQYRSEHSGSIMDTDEKVTSDNPELEKEYLCRLGMSMAHCVEELLTVAYNIAADAKENGNGDIGRAMRGAIEQSGIDSKGVVCLSLVEDAKSRGELVSNLCKRIQKKK